VQGAARRRRAAAFSAGHNADDDGTNDHDEDPNDLCRCDRSNAVIRSTSHPTHDNHGTFAVNGVRSVFSCTRSGRD